MGYEERLDGRRFDQMREISAKTGVIKQADGSATFRIGDTVAYAAVYGPRDLHPRFLQNPQNGILRCKYNMMPFSGAGDRVRPGGNRRSKELSLVMEKALMPVLNLNEFPNTVVDLFVEFPQTDAGTRCAGICAASMALADAGLFMEDLVSSVSVGKVDDKLVVDLSYKEESYDGEVADVPLAAIPRTGEVTLLQMDGRLTREQLREAVDMGVKACKEIYEVQKDALREKFVKEGAI